MNGTDFSEQSPIIALHRVWKYYDLGENRISALRGVDLRIERGEFVAIWGPSGSGKSTLCNLIGLIDDASEGEIHLGGREITELSDDRRSEFRNKTIGIVFQHFNLIPVLSALENVMLPLQIQGVPAGDAAGKATAWMVEVGLGDCAGQRPDKLSGGQRQRVAIARAMVTDPFLVIADEPTANLDSENAGKIIDLMREINRMKGTTFIFSTHDQRLLARVQRQVRLQDGTIVEDKRLQSN
ncbi:MAG: ABC transporter ATP-binding protein [Desulfobacteraceae bacterium]|nr:ABC transporter ATP-binding protein [Desulfobacteraceae bacterium]